MSAAATEEHLTKDAAGGLYWQPAAETLPTAAARRAPDRAAAGDAARTPTTTSRSTARRLDELGIRPGDVTCHGDVADLPFTTKIDLRDHYPFGMFARPRDRWCACTPAPARPATRPPSGTRAATSTCGPT